MKKLIKKYFPKRLLDYLSYEPELRFRKLSYSVHGEDLFLESFMSGVTEGTYLDLGCNHPTRFSNTFYFYSLGWSGVCIDPSRDHFDLFSSLRPRDILFNIGLGNPGVLEYFQFEQSAYNTMDPERAQATIGSRLVKVDKIQVVALADVLESKYPNGKRFNFISIDVEGLELEILQSNNWSKFSSDFILVEQNNLEFKRVDQYELTKYLNSIGYHVIAVNFNNILYSSNEHHT